MRAPRPHPATQRAQRDAAVQRLAQLTDPAAPWWAGHTVPRLSPDEPDDADGADEPGEPLDPPSVTAREPGRHAARRPAPPRLRERVDVPDLGGGLRWWLGPSHVAVLALVVVVGLVVTTWWVLRSHPSEAPAPTAVDSGPSLVELAGATTTASPSVPGASTSGAAPEGSVTVDVTGKVRHPGLAVLDAGSRVADALEAAGGARPGTDLSSLNLARVLVDGEQVVVGVGTAPTGTVPGPTPTGAAPTGSTGAPTTLVNLNTATEPELETLPEVGPVTAAAILAWRTEHGGFTAVQELLEVDGIGDATLAQLTPYVTV